MKIKTSNKKSSSTSKPSHDPSHQASYQNPETRFRWILTGAILGAAAAYILDPEKGRGRRAILLDKAKSLSKRTFTYSEKLFTHLTNKAKGLQSKTTRMFKHLDTDDDRLVRRVRSAIGHYVSHSRLIEVTAENGEVSLKGPVLESEIDNLIAQVEAVPGVKLVIDQLDVYDAPEQLAGLTPRKETFQ